MQYNLLRKKAGIIQLFHFMRDMESNKGRNRKKTGY